MKPLGIFVTPEELESVKNAAESSGMWGSTGRPFGDPEREVRLLKQKYNISEQAGLNIKTGEFCEPE
jgi:hypothetical protein